MMLSGTACTIPSSVTDVFLRPSLFDPSVLEVHLNTPTGTIPADGYLDGQGTSSTDTITGIGANITLHDFVPAAVKPLGGIVFNSGVHSTLEINAGPSDKLIALTSSSATGGTISVSDYSDDPANPYNGTDGYGAGIDNLVLRTSDYAATEYFPDMPTNTATPVTDASGTLVSIPSLASATHLLIDTGLATYATVTLGYESSSAAVTNTDIVTGAGHCASPRHLMRQAMSSASAITMEPSRPTSVPSTDPTPTVGSAPASPAG